jgi:tetratricopeptide (TPR) repeat protein
MAKKAAPPKPQLKKRDYSRWIPLGLILATVLVYWPVRHFQFVNFDDTDFVTANPVVQAGLTPAGFKWVWHSEVARNWHPLTMLTHMLDCQLFGLNAGGPHLVNLALHIVNTLLLYFLLKFMTRAIWRSAFVAALFALHPLHVESVAWIAERKDVLSTCFWFLSMWTYARYATSKPGWKYYVGSLLFFAMGLMSKPMLVTGPFVLVLLDFWPLQRLRPFRAKLIWEKLPYLAMSVALCVITYEIQNNGGAVVASDARPFTARCVNALISYAHYVELMFVPRNLAGLYLRTSPWPVGLAILATLFLAAMSIIAICQAKRRPWLTMGWLWYLGVLVPVIGLVQVGMQTMADRFTYVSLIGLFIIVAWGGAELSNRLRWPRYVLPATAGFVLTLCGLLTARQVLFWRDSETLFTRMIAVNPQNYMAQYNLANLYSREQHPAEAEAHYLAALQAEPNYADACNNLASLYLSEKRFDDALRQYAQALRVHPQPLFFLNYANTLADEASAKHDTNLFASAVQAYGQAILADPTSSDAHLNLGLTWQAQGHDAEAAAEFRRALALNPASEPAHSNLAGALLRLHSLDEAIAEYTAAEKLEPNRAETHHWLGVCYVQKNEMPSATTEFDALVRLQPNNATAQGNLANALAAQNKIEDAIPHYLAALQLDPGNSQTEFNLGLTLAHAGRTAEAAAHYEQALRLNPNFIEAKQALAGLPKARVQK